MENVIKALGWFIFFVGLVVFVAALSAFPVKWLWNWLMPTLFALKTISVWQAWGLTTLGGFLFKSSSYVKSKD